MAHLSCSCCGRGFIGKQDPAHDRGYGTCSECQEWISRHNEMEWRELEAKVRQHLNPRNQGLYDQLKKDVRRAVILQLIDDGVIGFRIGGRNGER